ncbi:MAG TPA: nuclear transport factor 2 family protein [Opitutaceae bacterium]
MHTLVAKKESFQILAATVNRLIAALIALTSHLSLHAADNAAITAVRAADDARVAAMIAADPVQLDAVLSGDLHYAHSDKLIETKAEHIASITSRKLIYRKIDYPVRDFSIVAPGVALSKGRALVEVGSERMMFRVDLHFLAVWRLEVQRWRLVAWQSSRIAEIVPLGPPASP